MRQRAIEKMRQNRVSSVSKRTNASSKNSGSRRYCLSQQSSSNSTAESSNTSTGEIHGQNVTDISSSSTGIVPGSFVCIRSAPIFHAGAIGFTVVGGVPKVCLLKLPFFIIVFGILCIYKSSKISHVRIIVQIINFRSSSCRFKFLIGYVFGIIHTIGIFHSLIH